MADTKPRVKFDAAGNMLVSSTQLCDLLRVTPEIISRHHKAGMPKAAVGWWNLREVLVYLGQAKGDNAKSKSASTRKLEAEADYKEAKAWANRILELKTSFTKLGKRIGSEFTDPEERARVEKVVNGLVEEYLESYARAGEYTPKVKATGKDKSKG